jgi:ribose transport system ATP-binding protein
MSTTTPSDAAVQDPVVQVRDASKTYGPTRALTAIDLDVRPGDVVGVVGHNGAGKSTLMRILAGIEPTDTGSVTVAGRTKPTRGGFPGARMAYQETNLANELSVGDNAYLSAIGSRGGAGWRKRAEVRIIDRLDEMFPGHGIAATTWVGDLTLAQRQMVEIARATLDDDLRLLILDEPTESLTGGATEALYDAVRRMSATGVAVILISHRIREVLGVASRVVVLRDGTVASEHPVEGLTEDAVLRAMGGSDVEVELPVTGSISTEVPVLAEVPARDARTGKDRPIKARRGEVIGLAGIAGQGQEDVLAAFWAHRETRGEKVEKAYVPGDRQRSGILPLWDVADNLGITAMRSVARWGFRNIAAENTTIKHWVDVLRVRGGAEAQMTGLSGGNQQKVIVARAFASDAELVLLDDPFRGVDVHTKNDLYRLIRDEAATGRTVVWYSSENAEMRHCDRVYVLRAGRIAAELRGPEISEERIIAESFVTVSDEEVAA